MWEAYIKRVTSRSTGVVPTLEGLPTGCPAGERGGDTAVLEQGDVIPVAGHGQHLLAGRARHWARLCPPHLLCHLWRPSYTLLCGLLHSLD